MKRLILILIAVLAVAALGAKLPIVEPYTYNGIPTAYDSVRRVVYNFNATTVLSNLVTADGDSIYREELNVDSCGTYKVNLTFYGNSQRLMVAREIVSNCYGKGAGATVALTADAVWDEVIGGSHELAGSSGDLILENNSWLTSISPGVQAIRDSGQYYAQVGGASSWDDTLNILVTYLQAIRDSGQYYAQVGSASGGCPDSVGNAWTIVAWDSVNNVAVPNATVTLKSTASSVTPLAQAKSGFVFTAANGTYYVAIEANSVTYPIRSFAISTSRTDTINGGGLSVIASVNPDLTTIYGYVDRNGSPVVGLAVNIVLTRPDTLTIDSAFIDFNHTVYTDANGVWQDDVYYLAGSTRNFYYTVTFTVAGQKRTLYCRPTAAGGPYLINNIMVEKP